MRRPDVVDRGMAQWRRERPDIDCSGKAVVGRILRLQDIIVRAANAALSRHGLRYTSYAVLATLRVSGAPYRMSPSQLTDTLLLSSGGTSNLLARLENKGWIRRLADPLDGRGVIVELTRVGRALADRAMADHAAMERQLVAMFDPQERAALAGLLSRMLVHDRDPLAWIGDAGRAQRAANGAASDRTAVT
ncbi:MAG: MarR family transcriptional regulator [Burkholderiales bacterium]|nr:MAG: MarR family transcriptional regulator [Burkholderiales bacterium]